jgi:hypothetical protein
MNIKKFNEYNYIKENILDEFEDDDINEDKWEVKVDGEHESYWGYKHDAIDRILELLENEGDEKGFEGYENEDGEELSKDDIADLLFDMDEDDFYEKLEELKEYINYDNDIKLYNIADDDELDFLEED